MKIHSIPASQILVSDRQRSEMSPEALVELATSIDENGLIHPVVVRSADHNSEIHLVAGGRRLQALDYLWNFGSQVKCGTQSYSEGHVPCLFLGEVDEIQAFAIELEENIRREDLSWQDRAKATQQLMQLRKMEAERDNVEMPTVSDLAKETTPNGGSVTNSHNRVRQDLILAEHLGDIEVAAAKTADEGMKILKRKEESRRSQALGISVGRTFGAHSHSLIQGDCMDWMKLQSPNQFDVILTDPPYGINAQDFNDSGGKTPGGHFYDDSYDNWVVLMAGFADYSFALAKPQAHLYVFCDIDNFVELRRLVSTAGWKPFRTPLVWINPSAIRAPWPTQGPQRKYQLCLYAVKGDKPILHLRGDVLEYRSDQNLGHPAQKPVLLYSDLLARSCRPGDFVLDPFCGSGTVFPAAHQLKIRATGVETDPTAYGIAVKRIGELK